MPSSLSLADVLTLQSVADYLAMAAASPDTLPPTLEELIELFTSTGDKLEGEREQALQHVIQWMQDPEVDCPSIQVWLLWTFNKAMQSIAAKYTSPGYTFDEAFHDTTWCLLETLNRLDPSTPYRFRNIYRITNKRMRTLHGLDLKAQAPEELPLDEMLESGWEPGAAAESSILRDLQLPKEEMYLLVGQYIYGFSQDELAEQLGIKPEALRQRMRRLLAKIRAQKK